jgi:hypothetical protein
VAFQREAHNLVCFCWNSKHVRNIAVYFSAGIPCYSLGPFRKTAFAAFDIPGNLKGARVY